MESSSSASPTAANSYPSDLQSLCNELLLQARHRHQQPKQQHPIFRPVAVATTTSGSSASGNTLYYHPQNSQRTTATSNPHDQYNVYQAHKLKIPMAMQGSIDHHQQQQRNQLETAVATSALQLLEQQVSSPLMLLSRSAHNNSNSCSLTLLSPPGTNQPAAAAPVYALTIPALPQQQSYHQNVATPCSQHHKSAFEFTSPTPTTPFPTLPMSPAVATPQQLAAAAAAVDALLLSSNFHNSTTQQHYHHHHQRSLSSSSSLNTPYTAAGGQQNKKFNIDSILAAGVVKSPTEALALLVEQLTVLENEAILNRQQKQRQVPSSGTTLPSPQTIADSFLYQQQYVANTTSGSSNESTSALPTTQMATQQAVAAIAAAQNPQSVCSSYATTISDLLNGQQYHLQSNVSGAVSQPTSLSYPAAVYYTNISSSTLTTGQQQVYNVNAADGCWQQQPSSAAAPASLPVRVVPGSAKSQLRGNIATSNATQSPDSSSSILRRRMQLENENNHHTATASTDENDEDNLVIDMDDSDSGECLADDINLILEQKQDGGGEDNEQNNLGSKKGSPKSRHGCADCRKVYSTYSGLVKHREHHCTALHTHHHQCGFCQKEYNTLGALKMHVKTHTLPCKCKVCGKAFSRPWLLQGHMRTHNGDKPFGCDDCGRSFADRSNLRAHQQTHAIVKRYKCVDCSKTFSRLSLLNKHRAGTACKQRLLKLHEQQQQQQQSLNLLSPLVCRMDIV